MDLNKLMQMAMKNAEQMAKDLIKEQEQRKVADLTNSNQMLIMAKTINRFIPAQLVVDELQLSVNELRDYYCQHSPEDDEGIEAISEVLGLAKGIVIDILAIADELEANQ